MVDQLWQPLPDDVVDPPVGVRGPSAAPQRVSAADAGSATL
jgi:hypothetical protein